MVLLVCVSVLAVFPPVDPLREVPRAHGDGCGARGLRSRGKLQRVAPLPWHLAGGCRVRRAAGGRFCNSHGVCSVFVHVGSAVSSTLICTLCLENPLRKISFATLGALAAFARHGEAPCISTELELA